MLHTNFVLLHVGHSFVLLFVFKNVRISTFQRVSCILNMLYTFEAIVYRTLGDVGLGHILYGLYNSMILEWSYTNRKLWRCGEPVFEERIRERAILL